MGGKKANITAFGILGQGVLGLFWGLLSHFAPAGILQWGVQLCFWLLTFFFAGQHWRMYVLDYRRERIANSQMHTLYQIDLSNQLGEISMEDTVWSELSMDDDEKVKSPFSLWLLAAAVWAWAYTVRLGTISFFA